MNSGYLYILSNPFLGPDLLKIGFTTAEPAERARALGRSTAIPGAFHLEFSMPVADCKAAERRLHLLLDEWRVDKNKEFFRLHVKDAKSLCISVGLFEREEAPPSDTLLMHRGFRVTGVTPRLGLDVLKALIHVLGATQHNALLDHLLEDRLLIVDGFTSATALAKFRKSSVRSASATLQRLAKCADAMTHPHPDDDEPMLLFAKFVYRSGHAAWTFQPKFRRLFATV